MAITRRETQLNAHSTVFALFLGFIIKEAIDSAQLSQYFNWLSFGLLICFILLVIQYYLGALSSFYIAYIKNVEDKQRVINGEEIIDFLIQLSEFGMFFYISTKIKEINTVITFLLIIFILDLLWSIASALKQKFFRKGPIREHWYWIIKYSLLSVIMCCLGSYLLQRWAENIVKIILIVILFLAVIIEFVKNYRSFYSLIRREV